MAVIVLDVEGEYTAMHEPTDNKAMLAGLKARNLPPQGVPAKDMTVYHLVEGGTANPGAPEPQGVLAPVRPALALRGQGDSRPV